MKKTIFIIGLIFIFGISNSIAQKECKVIPENLQGKYIGKCKKGFAHGKGEAKGIDHYIGRFKAGYPHGEGVYTYKNGDRYKGRFYKGLKHGEGKFTFKLNYRDSIQEGIFVKDEYKGPKPKPNYTINRKLNVARVNVIKASGSENKVRIKIIRDGNTAPYYNLTVAANSGISESASSLHYITSYHLPLRIIIKYDIRNRMNNGVFHCEIEMEIHNPGVFDISIVNN